MQKSPKIHAGNLKGTKNFDRGPGLPRKSPVSFPRRGPRQSCWLDRTQILTSQTRGPKRLYYKISFTIFTKNHFHKEIHFYKKKFMYFQLDFILQAIFKAEIKENSILNEFSHKKFKKMGSIFEIWKKFDLRWTKILQFWHWETILIVFR